MSPNRWQRFRWSIAVFAVIVIGLFFDKGVLDNFDLVSAIFLLLAFAGVSVAAYFFWKNLPDDSRWIQ